MVSRLFECIMAHMICFFFFSPLLSHPPPHEKMFFLSDSHHLVMIKTGGLWQRVRGQMIAGPGLQKRAIVSTLWLLLVLREMKAQVLAPTRHVIDGQVCNIRIEGLHKYRGSEVSFGMHNTTLVSNLQSIGVTQLDIQSSVKFIDVCFLLQPQIDAKPRKRTAEFHILLKYPHDSL